MSTNGQLDPATLTQVDGWALLETNTARAWVDAAAEVLAVTGIRPIITSPIGAYRSYAQQVATKAEFTAAGKGYQAAWPGTSNHGWGTAVDVNNISHFNQGQLDGLMRKHGFVRDVTFESWHYHHVANAAADAGAVVASSSSTPLVPVGPLKPKEEEDMKFLYISDSVDGNNIPGWMLLNVRTGKPLVQRNTGQASEQAIADSWATVWGSALKITRQDFLNAQAAIQQTA
jgi:hypothetical protein